MSGKLQSQACKEEDLDMIAANNLKVTGAGLYTDTNVITLIAGDMEKELPLMSKKEAAVF